MSTHKNPLLNMDTPGYDSAAIMSVPLPPAEVRKEQCIKAAAVLATAARDAVELDMFLAMTMGDYKEVLT